MKCNMAAAHIIDYGRPSKTIKRLLFKTGIVALLLAAIALAWRAISPTLADHRERWRYSGVRSTAFEKCLNYVETGSRSAFDEHRDCGAILVSGAVGSPTQNDARWCRYRGDRIGLPNSADLRSSTHQVPFAEPEIALSSFHAFDAICGYGRHHDRAKCASGMWQPPRVWGPPYTGSYRDSIVTLFLHERHSSNGGKRLVAITFDVTTFTAGDTEPITSLVYSAGSAFRKCPSHSQRAPLGFACPPSDPLILYFGAADPHDPSHLTIPFRVGRRSGAIHGWLQPDETVKLSALKVPVAD